MYKVKKAGAPCLNGQQWYIVKTKGLGKGFYLHNDYILRKEAIQEDNSGYVYYTGWYKTRQEARDVVKTMKGSG